MLESNLGLLQLRHWQSDVLTTRLDLIHWLDGTSQEPIFTSQSVEWTDCDVTAKQVYNTVEWDREKAWVY